MSAKWFGDRAQVVAIANNKGGVGKSLLTANMAGWLSMSMRVLLVGLDLQQGQTIGADLGVTEDSDQGESLARAMLTGAPVEILRDVRPGLDLISDGKYLELVIPRAYSQASVGEVSSEALEDLIAAQNSSFGYLRPVLAPLLDEYDIILLDCPPSSRPLIRAALGAADWLLIPTNQDAASIEGLGFTAEEFVNARAVNPGLRLAGVVLMAADGRAPRVRKAAQDQLDELFNGNAPLFAAYTRFAQPSVVRGRAEHLLAHELTETESKGDWRTNSVPLANDFRAITNELVVKLTTASRGKAQQ